MPLGGYSNSGPVRPSALGGREVSCAARTEALLVDDKIERSGVIEIGAETPFARKFARFRLDRDIVEDHIGLLARAVSMLWGGMPKFAFFSLCVS